MLLWMLLLAALPAIPLDVLVFSKTVEYRHDAIPDGTRAIVALGEKHGWTVEATEDASRFTDEYLARFDVIVFLMTTGDVLDEAQQGAFERFVQSGKGYVGIHAASDTEYDWPWYGNLVGAYFKSHPEIQEATYDVEDRSHPATRHLPERWTRVDEHYNFVRNPRPNVHVLLALDESSYEIGKDAMGDHPAAWYHEVDGGRAFYTALGHTKESYADQAFLRHLEGAITWAAAKVPQATRTPPEAVLAPDRAREYDWRGGRSNFASASSTLRHLWCSNCSRQNPRSALRSIATAKNKEEK